MNYIRQVMNPAWYHGYNKQPPFFEGWYFKVIDPAEQQLWAFIPGVFIHDDPARTHAFIQVLNGSSGEAFYHRYPFDAFHAQPNAFDVRLGGSRFRQSQIDLDINDELGRIQGTLAFENLTPWPVTALSPGIMGPFGWLGFMECYHGVLSLDHTISGTLDINGDTIDFSGGRGYIEKDWGQSFPAGYIWQQTNHFEQPGTSLTASIAMIPNFGFTFPGFIVGVWHENELYKFTTYNRSQVDHLRVTDDSVEWVLHNRQHELTLHSRRARGGLLKGPQRDNMHMRVDETMQAEINMTLTTRHSGHTQTLFKGCGRNAALEVVGNLEKIITS